VGYASACALAACGKKDDHPPLIHDSDAESMPAGPAYIPCVDDAAPPTPTTQGYCGNTFLEATTDHPNLYFVIDRSGSMGDLVEGVQKYGAVARAATSLVRALGPRANIGATVFPGRGASENPCALGSEVFPTQPGDALPSGSCGDRPITRAFASSIGGVPIGSTPTAISLAAVLPTLEKLSGKTAVILATDGGPNCNANAACDASKCIPNIEQQCQPAGVNCCDAVINGPEACLDEEPTRAAVAALHDHGIPTYVIGIPGSAPYAALLDELAAAGGTARPMEPAYYDVQHLDELDAVLAAIGTKVVLSCHLQLESAPPRRDLVNVYLDRQQLTYGVADGWKWSDDADGGFVGSVLADASFDDASSEGGSASDPADAFGAEDAGSLAIDLVGAACDKLTAGEVQQVQIVFGCPTAIIR
jgi:hypothetical protein